MSVINGVRTTSVHGYVCYNGGLTSTNDYMGIWHEKQQIERLKNEPFSEISNYNGEGNFDVQRQLEVDYRTEQEVKKHTVMIYRLIDGQEDAVATAVYLSHKGASYLITAGHTFNDFKQTELFLYFPDRPIQLSDCHGVIHHPGKENSYCYLDIAIIYVYKDKCLKDALSANGLIPFVQPSEQEQKNYGIKYYRYDTRENIAFCSPGAVHEYGLYNILYGYPCSWNKSNLYNKRKKFEPRSLCLNASFANELKDSSLEDINTKYPEIDFTVHNINPYDKYAIQTGGIPQNKIEPLPKLHGMSGCGIWDFANYPYCDMPCLLEGIFLGLTNDDVYMVSAKFLDVLDTIESTGNNMRRKGIKVEKRKGLVGTTVSPENMDETTKKKIKKLYPNSPCGD